MLEIIISILISLNIQFTQIDDRSLQLSKNSNLELQSSTQFQTQVEKGVIHDLVITYDEVTHDEIIILPEVDPKN